MTPAVWGGALAGLWALVHLFLGGREVAGPLRHDRTLPEVVRVTAWMCWHMVTAALAVMATLLVWGGLAADGSLVLAGTLLAAGVAIAGCAAAPILGVGFGTLPQGPLFLPVVALGLWALA